jgi:hypothetical protein
MMSSEKPGRIIKPHQLCLALDRGPGAFIG